MPLSDRRACAQLRSCARSKTLTTYRDDHAAAVFRIDALERALDEERARSRDQADFDRKRIEMLERELADLHRNAGRDPPLLRRTPPPPQPAHPSAGPTRRFDELDHADRGPPVSIPLLVTLLVFTSAVIALAISLW